MRYKIYDSEGKTEKSEVKELEYNGVFKGERYITVKAASPYPIDFKVGDRLTYHGETFTLRDISSIKRNARNYQSGNSIEYDGLRFLSSASELYDIQFCDYVLNDNNLPYTGLGTFSFYVSKAEDFGSRIQANLDLNYGEGRWQVVYGDNKEINKAKTMSISSDTNVYDALIQFSNDYDVNFIIKGYTITIGFTQDATEYKYFYGKGHGLTSLEVTSDTNQRVVTRLKAYGSQRNIPYLYYTNLGKEYVVKVKSSTKYTDSTNIRLILSVDLGLEFDENDSVFTDKVNPGSQTGWHNYRIKVRAGENEVMGMIECNGTGSLQPANEADIYIGLDYYETDSDAVNKIIDYFNGISTYPTDLYIIDGYDSKKVPYENINVPSGIPNNMSVKNLMLPGYPSESLNDWAMRVSKDNTETGSKVLALINEGFKFSDNQYFPYIISPNADTYGTKDGEVTFDGSDEDWDEVYPSLEDMTTTELNTIAGYEGSDTFENSGEVDRMLSDSDIKDNGVSSDGTYGDGSKDTEGTLMYASFEMTIPNIGFNLWDYKADGETPVIHMQDGMCVGRSFEILRCIPVDADDITKGYRLKLQREVDQNVNMYYPNKIYNISAGDKFVLEGIEMPDVYVEAASVRLFFEAIEKLRDIDYLEKTYKPEIDNIFMARHPEYAEELVEGVYFVFEDKELGIDNIGITIQQLTIREEGGNIAQYEISLNNDKEENLLNAINKSISKAGEAIKKESKTEIANFTRDMVTKVDTDFFSRVFDVMGTNDKPIEVNDSESEIKSVKVKYGLWSEAFLSALGLNGEGSSGGGSFDLLQDWDKYVDETAKSMALSAYLGKDLLDRVASLESGQKGHKITISGSGNVVIDVGESSDGSTLTFTKGNIDLSGYATTTALAEVSNKADAVTEKVNDFLEGTDTDNIINRWKELEAFLAGQTQTSTLSELLAVKANKSVRVNAGEGLAGGGSLSLDVTLSLATVGTEGTYTKVIVDKYGRVTGHASLTATDIPVLDISKINGLQGELDKKLNTTDFGSEFAAEMANWFKKDTDGNVFVANAKGFYSESFVSALGKSSGGSSSGGSSFDLLQDWNKYDDSTAKNTALSAYLGKSLLDRMVLDFSDIDNCRINGTGKSGVFDVYSNGHSIGTLLVSNDVMSHGTNQLFITNMLMDVDGNSHQDDRIYVYYRYYNFNAPNAVTEKGTWSKWCLVIGSKAGENGIARIKGIRDNDIDGIQNAIGVWAIDGTAYNAASETDIINIFN